MSTALGLLNPLAQFFADDGTPLAGGLVYAYAAGSTTPQDTFFNADLAPGHENTNPVVLDAYGKAVIYLSPVNYKIDVQTPGGVSTDGYPRDDIAGSPFTSTLTVAQGGTGLTSFTDKTVIISSGSTFRNTSVGTPGQVLTSSGGLSVPDFSDLPPEGMTLLHASSGTDTNAGATTVDTVTMLTHLTVLDSLLVLASMVSKTQITAAPSLYNVTDSIAIATSPAQVGLAVTNFFEWTVRQDRFVATNFLSKQLTFDASNVGVLAQANVGMSAAWTSGWTLGLRHGGVTAGGTLYWSWAVYRLNGQ